MTLRALVGLERGASASEHGKNRRSPNWHGTAKRGNLVLRILDFLRIKVTFSPPQPDRSENGPCPADATRMGRDAPPGRPVVAGPRPSAAIRGQLFIEFVERNSLAVPASKEFGPAEITESRPPVILDRKMRTTDFTD